MAFQMALELHYWEEFSVEEIATVLDVSPGTVKSRLHRGREKLRQILAVQADDESLEAATRRLGRRLLGQ